MRSVFVTGTDTGVGKTVLTAAICATTGATPMKPVQTGTLEAEDLNFVTTVTGVSVDENLACPYRFPDPLAPAVAASRVGQTIDIDHIEECFAKLSADGPVVVEGAGGILVEITEGVTMADLAKRLSLPVVIACRPGLGTLNHSALTVEAARAHGLEVIGLVVVGYPSDPDLAESTNLEQLARIAPIVGVIPYFVELRTSLQGLGDGTRKWLASLLGGSFQV